MFNKKMFNKKMVTIIVVILLSACGGNQNGKNTTENQEEGNNTENQGVTANFLSDENALKQAKESLENLPAYKGKEINVFQNMRLSDDGRITIEVQDPEKPENIDHYEYENGKWSEPEPVQISGGGDMSANITPIKDIDFTKLPSIVKIYEEKAKEVEAKKTRPDYVYFSLFVPNQMRRWGTPNIQTDRAKYQIDFNLDGSLKEFKKN